jgi:bla regulator protein blaR1
MLAWAVYMTLVAALVSAAALAAEKAARLRLVPTRWIWVAAIASSLLIPVTIGLVWAQMPAVVSSTASDRLVAPSAATSGRLTPPSWMARANAAQIPGSRQLDSTLRISWALASVTLVLVLTGASAHLAWRQRRWTPTCIGVVPVYIARDLGPAVVGLLRPRVVVPGWLSELPEAQQTMVVAHEQSHVEAGDPQLLALALCALVCAPWNLPLWWQLRRLRRAIEIDCDGRVLKRGGDPVRYGDTLLAVGRRQSLSMISVAGMSESSSFIEERITLMLRKPVKSWSFAAAALAVLSLSLVAVAAQVSPPPASTDAAGSPGTQAILVHLPASVLDRYTGFYAYGDHYSVTTVRRVGDHLTVDDCGQGPRAIYPQSATQFFFEELEDNGAGMSFVPGADGMASTAVLHQNGASTPMPRVDAATAQTVCSALTTREQSQTPTPGTEAMLLRVIDGIVAGKPNLDEMNPQLAAAIHADLPKLQVKLAALGAVQSVHFVRVSHADTDVYQVVHEHGSSKWGVALDSKGVLVGLGTWSD